MPCCAAGDAAVRQFGFEPVPGGFRLRLSRASASYPLGVPASGTVGAEPLAGRPVVEVKPVLVPDYLDVSDMLLGRNGDALVQSRTGRWAERLSVGFTRALKEGLARLLPGAVVTSTAPPEEIARQVLVDVDAFEPHADGTLVLVASWRVLDGQGRHTLAGERANIVEKLESVRDAEVAAAMTQAIETLAVHVAQGIRKGLSARLGA